jgi:type II secretory pathway pseudopilin PulG
MGCLETKRGVEMERQSEQGFMLVGLIVAIFLILLALSVAAPKVAEGLRREREVEAIHRGNQYVRAIRLYYRKSNTYPATIDALEKANNIRYLRQQYIDPMTGKVDWRLIHVGEAKTTVKGFFGQPLAGLATGPGAGMSSGTTTPGTIGASGTGASGGQQGMSSVFGASGSGGYGASSPGGGGLGSSSSGGLGGSTLGGGSSLGGTSTQGGLGSSAGGTSGGLGASNPGSNSSSGQTGTNGSPGTIGGQSASSFSGSAMPFVGVGVPKEGDSITILNEQTTYNTWEFLYDPRIEQLYAKGALLGGGSTALGSGSGSSSGTGMSGTNSNGFGSSPSPGFGSTPGSGLGSSPGNSSPTIGAPVTAPSSPQQPY